MLEPLIEGSRQRAVPGFLRWELAAKQAVGVLAEAGLRPIVLKGGATKYRLYPEPWYRPSSDVDLLVPEAGMEEAVHRLERAGFALHLLDQERRFTALQGHQVSLARGGFLVELHRSLDNLAREGADYEGLLPGAMPLCELGAGALAPAAEDAAAVAALHALKHGLDIPLRHLVDLHLLVSAGGFDFGRACGQAERLGAGGVLGFLLACGVEMLGTAVPEGVLERLRPRGGKALLVRAATSPWVEGFFVRPGAGSDRLRKLAAQLLFGSGAGEAVRLVARYLERRAGDRQESRQARQAEGGHGP
jgi:hypothetical protein